MQWGVVYCCMCGKQVPSNEYTNYSQHNRNSRCIILIYCMNERSKSCFESTQALKNTFWRQIQVSHTYDVLKLYNVNLECDVTFCQIFIACCRKRISFFKHGHKVNWKGFDEYFMSSNLKAGDSWHSLKIIHPRYRG